MNNCDLKVQYEQFIDMLQIPIWDTPYNIVYFCEIYAKE